MGDELMDGTVDLAALQTPHNAPQDDVGADVVEPSMKAAGSIGLVHRDKLFEPLAR
ncbi:hypothetical protein [Mesorhizobium sp. f-mel]